MACRYEVEVTVCSARDLKNVNWRHGDLKPYAVLWIDDGPKCSTRRVDLHAGDGVWNWDEDDHLLPLPPSTRLHDAVLYADVVHADAADGVKPLVGSASLPLRDVLDDAGIGARASRTLRLKRPSGRPQGTLDVVVAVREAALSPYPPPPTYGHGQPAGARDVDPYSAAYPYAAPPSGYPAAYGAPPPASGYPASSYGPAPPASAALEEKRRTGMGMGTGLAVGAAAGVLGGLALAEGASYLEDKVEEEVAERVEEDLADDSYGGDGGFDDDF